jgi:hypothetical protein
MPGYEFEMKCKILDGKACCVVWFAVHYFLHQVSQKSNKGNET